MYDAQNTLLGMVILAYSAGSVQEERLRMVQAIVVQLTMNLQKSRLLRESQNQAAQMQRLTTFSEAMQATLRTSELLSILLERLPYLLPVDYCAVLLYDRKVGQLRVAALSHQGENDVTLPGTLLEAGSDTIAQHIWETQEAIWINALQDTWTWKHPFITNLQTILAAPLTTNGVRIGVLELGSEQANRYSQMDMVTFEQVSTQLSVGLSNAEAYSQSQQLARNKMLANDIVAQLQRQMEVEDILRITATELGQALGATRARVRLGFDTRKEGDTDG
jgi:GAF domain-containing protein